MPHRKILGFDSKKSEVVRQPFGAKNFGGVGGFSSSDGKRAVFLLSPSSKPVQFSTALEPYIDCLPLN